ncbi:MAG TPA: DUF6483 family protein [Ignavibacteria bacterium]|nr:hypothetical protein [Ignavibacteria bacterium]HRJ03330.1 DUF6483 family protein [Ignavibacteria bacterium]HRJ85999.1 DUF6483 family protein [Ignavibacteria bacterium]
MFRKDYIMRMIEDFIKAMAKIIMMREQKSYTDARTELDGLSKLVTGFGVEHLISLGAPGIKYVFSQNKESEAEKIYCSARILKEEGLILKSQGKTEDSLKSLEISKELFKLASQMEIPEKNEALKEFEELSK